LNRKCPAFDLERVPFDQGFGDLAAGLGHDALEGGTGNSHPPGCLLLSEALQVGQADGFQLFVEQGNTA
jgi:hypothetical protein